MASYRFKQERGSQMNTAPRHDNNDHTITVMIRPTGAHSRTQAATKAARSLALGAVAGPVLLTVAWLVLGFLSPGYSAWGTWIGPYSPIHQGISGLGMGVTAPYMNTAFVVGGLIVMVGAIGIFQSIREIGGVARWSCTVLLALSGLGMAMDG